MRSLLFVPGDSPSKLEKALASPADALIIDLEDSVAAERKAQARSVALGFLERAQGLPQRPSLMIRVNSLDSGLTDADLAGVLAGRPDAIMLPKAEGAQSVIGLDAKLTVFEAIHGIMEGATQILALATETAAALFLAGTYRNASSRLLALSWGAEDLSLELGAETNRGADGAFTEPFRLARSLCLAGAAAARIDALDTVYVDFRDLTGLRREAEEARRDGFVGKLAIHPAQIAVINEVFTPTPAGLADAQRIVDAFHAQPEAGVIAVAGVMYDRPHLERAKRLLVRANRLELRPRGGAAAEKTAG